MSMELASVHVSVRGDTAALRHDMRSAKKVVDDSLHRTRERSYQTFNNVSRDIAGGFTAVMTPIAAMMDKMISDAVRLASEFEQTQLAFEVMLGNVGRAGNLLDDLSHFAATTPFQIGAVEKGARQLMAVGFEAEEVVGTLKTLGDIAAGIGQGDEGLRRLILNFGQVRAQTLLTGRELRDFAILGVPLIDALAKQFGVGAAEIKKMTEQGKITADDVTKAFTGMTKGGGRFADMMAKQATTAAGLFSNMLDTVTLKLRALGQFIMQEFGIKDLIKGFTQLVDRLDPSIAGTVALTAAFVTLASVIGAAVFTMEALNISMRATFIGGGIGVAIGLLAGVLSHLIITNKEAIKSFFTTNKHFLKLKATVLDLWKSVKTKLVAAWETLSQIFEKIKEPLMFVILQVSKFAGTALAIQGIGAALKGLAVILAPFIAGLVVVAAKWAAIGFVVSGVIKLLTQFVKDHQAEWIALTDTIKAAVTPVFTWIQKQFDGFMGWLDLFSSDWGTAWQFMLVSANTAILNIVKHLKIAFHEVKKFFAGMKDVGFFLAQDTATGGNFTRNALTDLKKQTERELESNIAELPGLDKAAAGGDLEAEKRMNALMKRNIGLAEDLEKMRIALNEGGPKGAVTRAQLLASANKNAADAKFNTATLDAEIEKSLAEQVTLYKDLVAAQDEKNKKAKEEAEYYSEMDKLNRALARTRQTNLHDVDRRMQAYMQARGMGTAADGNAATALEGTGGRIGIADFGNKMQDAIFDAEKEKQQEKTNELLKESNITQKEILERVNQNAGAMDGAVLTLGSV